MKIALVAHCLYPIKEPFEGGLEMLTYLLCRSLMERGHEVHLYGHRDSDKVFNIHPIPTECLYPSEMISQMGAMGQDATAVRESLGYAKIMNEIAHSDYDIVHNHSLHYMPILMGNGLHTPMITSIHTPKFPYLQFGGYGVKGDNHQIFTMVSESLAKTWEKIIPTATVIHNGIDLSKWEYIERPVGSYLFWYGRICPEKGTEFAIKAAMESNSNLVLAGPISNRDYYDTEIVPLLGHINIDYIGHMSQEKIVPLLGNAKALLFTSTWDEPYGLTLAESLACGTPVIAFEGGATSEILTDETGILVSKRDIDGMVAAVHKVTGIKRAACRRRAEEFCSHEIMVEGYLTLYDRLLEHREYKMQLIP